MNNLRGLLVGFTIIDFITNLGFVIIYIFNPSFLIPLLCITAVWETGFLTWLAYYSYIDDQVTNMLCDEIDKLKAQIRKIKKMKS